METSPTFGTDAGDVMTPANPEIAEAITKLVQGAVNKKPILRVFFGIQ